MRRKQNGECRCSCSNRGGFPNLDLEPHKKYFIEDSTTKKSIPIDALICKQSLEDAITTMKKSITQSVPHIVEKIKMAIRKRTERGTKVIVAGIGNTIGVGIQQYFVNLFKNTTQNFWIKFFIQNSFLYKLLNNFNQINQNKNN